MAISDEYYGTVDEGDAYFAARLHEAAWSGADPADRPKALLAATRIIDSLNFKGYKATVYALLQGLGVESVENAIGYGYTTAAAVYAAELAQPLEFPRGADTEVPESIRRATYEIAHALLDGRDPELEMEAIGIKSHRYANIATEYQRDHTPIEHLMHGVVSMTAWQLLKPFLRDDEVIRLNRVS
jgi:hypothetical protein